MPLFIIYMALQQEVLSILNMFASLFSPIDKRYRVFSTSSWFHISHEAAVVAKGMIFTKIELLTFDCVTANDFLRVDNCV